MNCVLSQLAARYNAVHLLCDPGIANFAVAFFDRRPGDVMRDLLLRLRSAIDIGFPGGIECRPKIFPRVPRRAANCGRQIVEGVIGHLHVESEARGLKKPRVEYVAHPLTRCQRAGASRG